MWCKRVISYISLTSFAPVPPMPQSVRSPSYHSVRMFAESQGSWLWSWLHRHSCDSLIILNTLQTFCYTGWPQKVSHYQMVNKSY